MRSISTGLLLFLSVALAQNECYYAAGERAGSAIIPCGDGSSISSCCQIGDLCLSDSACWNPTYNVTYLYGCTDSSYQDYSCPWKCGADFAVAPYVGLDYCYNTTQNEWSCTHPPSNSDSIQEFPAQQCYDDSIIAFAGPSSLQPILSLPKNIGGSTVWFSQVNPTSYSLDPYYTPTTTSIQVTASVPTAVEVVSTISATDTTISSNAPITGVTPSSASTAFTPTNTPAAASTSSQSTATSSPSSGLSTGAKAGIGVGAALGGLGLIALIAAFFLLRRRRTHQPVPQTEETGAGFVAPEEKRPRPPSELPGNVPAKYEQPGGSSGFGDSSTVGNWGSAAPTYSAAQQQVGPRPAGADRVHELG